MGYDTSRFVGEIDKGFLCSICCMVLENPLQTPCEHTFCSECINEWLKMKNNCPVDRAFLDFDDLKPTPRYFRTMVDNMKIRCDFEPTGCQTILPLEHLKDHVISCTFHPNFEVVCDKGCNMTMTRREYDSHNCFVRQKEEIAELKLKLCLQQYDIKKLKNKTSVPLWQENDNIKISAGNILEKSGNSSRASTQLSNHLTKEKPSFQIQILDISPFDVIEIALASEYNINERRPFCYSSDGKVFSRVRVSITRNDSINEEMFKWKKGDIIKCEIQFPSRNGSKVVAVNFTKNQQIIAYANLLWADWLFPTIEIYTNGNSQMAQASKVFIFNN